MKKKTNIVDKYIVSVFDKMMIIAPLAGLSAAITFTSAKLFGFFKSTSFLNLIIFDIICLSYLVIGYILRKNGITENGEINSKKCKRVQLHLALLIILQWNLISYIFPTSDFWGFALMFVILNAFMFDADVVLVDMILMIISIGISWIINPNLLPAKDQMFSENLILRIVCILVSFVIAYSLTYYAEKFKKNTKSSHEDLEIQNEKLDNMSKDVISYTADLIERRDPNSGQHVRRVKDLTYMLASEVMKNYPEYNLTSESIELISVASSLHDVGKICIPDNILLKPGKLTEEEFNIIKTHTEKGKEIIDKLPDSVEEDFKKYCSDICLYHHEKFDGKGYPLGLVGDNIPISAQIVSIVDCFDALTSKRPYKEAYSKETAINMILAGECGAFSDKMKDCLLKTRSILLGASQ